SLECVGSELRRLVEIQSRQHNVPGQVIEESRIVRPQLQALPVRSDSLGILAGLRKSVPQLGGRQRIVWHEAHGLLKDRDRPVQLTLLLIQVDAKEQVVGVIGKIRSELFRGRKGEIQISRLNRGRSEQNPCFHSIGTFDLLLNEVERQRRPVLRQVHRY